MTQLPADLQFLTLAAQPRATARSEAAPGMIDPIQPNFGEIRNPDKQANEFKGIFTLLADPEPLPEVLPEEIQQDLLLDKWVEYSGQIELQTGLQTDPDATTSTLLIDTVNNSAQVFSPGLAPAAAAQTAVIPSGDILPLSGKSLPPAPPAPPASPLPGTRPQTTMEIIPQLGQRPVFAAVEQAFGRISQNPVAEVKPLEVSPGKHARISNSPQTEAALSAALSAVGTKPSNVSPVLTNPAAAPVNVATRIEADNGLVSDPAVSVGETIKSPGVTSARVASTAIAAEFSLAAGQGQRQPTAVAPLPPQQRQPGTTPAVADTPAIASIQPVVKLLSARHPVSLDSQPEVELKTEVAAKPVPADKPVPAHLASLVRPGLLRQNYESVTAPTPFEQTSVQPTLTQQTTIPQLQNPRPFEFPQNSVVAEREASAPGELPAAMKDTGLLPTPRAEASMVENTSLRSADMTQLTNQPAGSQPAPGSVVSSAAASVPATATPLNNPVQPVLTEALALPRNADSADWGKGLGERVSWMINQKHNSASIRLDPPHLGKLDVQLKLADDITTITIQTQHAQTRDLVEASVHRLRDFLQENGYHNVNVDVSHKQDQQHSDSQDSDLSENEGQNTNVSANSTDINSQSRSIGTVSDRLVDTFV